MPRFFFDFVDGPGSTPDHEGTDHPSFEAAEREALDTLILLARDKKRADLTQPTSVSIRDEHGAEMATYTLSVTVTFSGR